MTDALPPATDIGERAKLAPTASSVSIIRGPRVVRIAMNGAVERQASSPALAFVVFAFAVAAAVIVFGFGGARGAA